MTQLTPTAIRAASLSGLWADLAGIRNAPLDLLSAAVAAALEGRKPKADPMAKRTPGIPGPPLSRYDPCRSISSISHGVRSS